MVRDVRVHLLPALFEPEDVRGGIAVVLDILRASTTIVHALAHGASCVIPTVNVDDARSIANGLMPVADRVLLGGEREGLLIPGFHLDNNPFAYTADVVRGKTVVFTTTNGTAALHRAAQTDRVLIGAFVNLQAVVAVLVQDDRPVHLVCAGTKGKITTEDCLCAGAIVDRLAQALQVDALSWTDDQLQLAWRLYVSVKDDPAAFRETLRNSYGGRNCRRLGFDTQIDCAGTLDLFDVVPEYRRETGRIESA
jgi:2-phosphosulfolactate phosphatase